MWSSPKKFREPRSTVYELDRQSQTRRRGCHCWELRMNYLLFEDELVLHVWIFSTGSSGRIWSVFCCVRCDQAGTKISSKKIEALYLLRCPRQCILQVSRYILQQVETFKYLGMVFTSGGSRNKGIDTRIGKETQFYVSFIAPWWRNGSFQRPQSCQFLNGSLFRSSAMVMNLGDDWKNTV